MPLLSRFSSTSSSYPVIPTCPLPTCECQQMPDGLDIDYKRTLNGTVAPYSDHLLIHTGTYDWPSKIEADERHPLAHKMKVALRKISLSHLSNQELTFLSTTPRSLSNTQKTMRR